MKALLLPPASVKGMKILNKESFQRDITVPVLKLTNTTFIAAKTHIKKYMLSLQNFKSVQSGSDENTKIIFLNPSVISSLNSLPQRNQEALSLLGINTENFQFAQITLTYDNWKPYEIIHSILPDSIMFASYSTVGHIIQVNLRTALLPYKHIIGEVLLDKIKGCRTVVNKTNEIDSCFRNFNMEVIAGSSELVTIVKENGCSFELDFSQVYWNSRLCTERNRILLLLKKNDIVFDVFAGVGPFSVPAAKKGCYVLANDLNPACIKWLEHNKTINAIKKGVLITSNKDGFSFIKENFKAHLLTYVKNERYADEVKAHVIMNLPSLTHTFLSTFIGLLDENEIDSIPDNLVPIVHAYCFVKNEAPEHAVKIIQEALNTDISNLIIEIFNVRNVASNKEMIRVSFLLNKFILSKNNSDELSNKRSIENDSEKSNYAKRTSSTED